jgi:hypothetical protein
MATEVGEAGCKNTSKSESGGKGGASHGGGAGRGSTVAMDPSIKQGEPVGLGGWRQGG